MKSRLLSLFLFAAACTALAGPTPFNTLVVVNANSRDSRALGAYYAEKHGIPPVNVCSVRTDPKAHSITPEQLEKEILAPIRLHLQMERLEKQIDFLVLCLDFPSRVQFFNSVTSAIFYGFHDREPNSQPCSIVQGSGNQYFMAERAYSSQAGWNRTNAPIAFLLTAPTLDGAKALVDRACEANAAAPLENPLFCLHGSADAARTGPRSPRYAAAALSFRLVPKLGRVDVHEKSSPVPAEPVSSLMTGVAYLPTNYAALKFAPGAIADHLTSCGGMIPDPCLKQSTVWSWFNRGATVSYGTVCEPCAFAAKFPDPMLPFYCARGFSAGEALAMSVRNPYQGLFAGDPFASPHARAPKVELASPAGHQTEDDPLALPEGMDTLNLSVTLTAHPDGAPPVFLDLYLDGRHFAAATRPVVPTGNDLVLEIGTNRYSYTVAPGEDLFRATAGLAWAVNANAHHTATASETSDRILLTVRNPLDDEGRPLRIAAHAEKGFANSLCIDARAATEELVVDPATGQGNAMVFVSLGHRRSFSLDYSLNLTLVPPGPHVLSLLVRDGSAVQTPAWTSLYFVK